MQTTRKRTFEMIPAEIETLESRELLSAVTLTDDGTLSIQGTRRGDQIAIVQQDDQVFVNFNGRQSQFALADVSRIVAKGGRGHDTITLNGADLPAAVLSGGRGNDNVLVVASNANNLLIGGRGNDLVSTTGQGADTLIGGKGRDTLYAIVGAANTVISGQGRDKLITRDGVEVTDANRKDTVIAFRFDRPKVDLRDGVLYLMGDADNDQYIIREEGREIVVTLNDSGGNQEFRFQKREVKQLAGILLAGDDTLVNLTKIDATFYGASGNDILIGGGGDDVLKGGSGKDLIIGRGGRDFLTGDADRDLVLADRNDFVLQDLDDLFIAGVF